MTLVSSSSASASRKSVSSRSALLPMLMSLARPSCRSAAQSRIAVQRAPDCEMTEMPPAPGHVLRERGVHVVVRVDQAEAVRAQQPHVAAAAAGRELPFQRGAFRPDLLEAGRDHDQRAGARRRSRPPPPPARPAVGTAITARSDGVADVPARGLARQPQDLAGRRVDGRQAAREPARIRLARISWPTLPGVRDAPTTAICFGFNKASSIESPLSVLSRAFPVEACAGGRGRRPAHYSLALRPPFRYPVVAMRFCGGNGSAQGSGTQSALP